MIEKIIYFLFFVIILGCLISITSYVKLLYHEYKYSKKAKTVKRAIEQ